MIKKLYIPVNVLLGVKTFYGSYYLIADAFLFSKSVRMASIVVKQKLRQQSRSH